MEDMQTTNPRGEIIKFVILVAVMLITILVVAVTRPFIFGRVVPAVLGEGQVDVTAVDDDTDSPTKAENGEAETPADTAGGDAEEMGEGETAVEDAPAASEKETGSEAGAESETETHVVLAGETVYAIARKYGVDVDAIVEANDLADPNRVTVGQTLVIPNP